MSVVQQRMARVHHSSRNLRNKVKLTTRKSYGFRTEEAIKTCLYHNLAALPEPNFSGQEPRGRPARQPNGGGRLECLNDAGDSFTTNDGLGGG